MIRPIESKNDCKWIFEAGGYPEKWPGWLEARSDYHVVLGAYAPDLVGCFPVQFWPLAAEIHVAFHPHFRGEFAKKSAQEVFRWVWDNTNYHTIIADIENPHVARYAERCGMRKVGDHYEVRKWDRL